ncbi:MAG: hypothetical protein ACI8ZM_000620 [Crocinitomix sp.]|jgi:hypothetical protein
MRLLIFSYLIVFSVNSLVHELKPQYRNYDVNDGLPSSQIYEIIEDSKGYIWFGTDRGLVRYNGYEFETFTVSDGLTSNVVYHLNEGPDGTIYCYNQDQKINYFRNNKFHEFKYNDSLVKLQSTNSNLIKFDFTKKGIILNSRSSTDEGIANIVMSVDGQLTTNAEYKIQIVDNENGVYIFGKIKGVIYEVFINGKEVLFDKPQEFRGFFSDIVKYQSTYYFTVGESLFQYDLNSSNKIVLIKKFQNEILDLEIDDYGNLYLGLRYDGLMKLPNRDIRFAEYMISDANISSVLVDANEGVWAASLFRGLFYIENQENKSVELTNDVEISELETFGDAIYMWSSELDVYNLNKLNEPALAYSKTVLSELDLETDSLMTFKGVYTKGGCVIDLRSNLCYFADPLKSYILKEGELIGISRTAVKKWGEKVNCVDFIHVDLKMNCGMIDNQNRLIVGADGVKVILRETAELDTCAYSQGDYRCSYFASTLDFMPNIEFFGNKVRDMKNIGDSLTVFGSAEKGVYIQQEGEKDLWLKKENGLISDAIDQIYFKDGYLVFLSKNGLCVLTEDGRIVNYTRRNGLLSNEVHDVVIRNDTIWTVTNNGTSLFSLKRESNATMPINFTSFKVNEISQPIQASYELTYQDQMLEISYEALSFIQEGKVNYKYQLKGVDNNWISTQNRSVRYTYLPAGQFSFWLMAQNSDNSWTQPTCLFEVSKPKPFWLTIYFIGFVLLLIIGLTGLFFRWRYRRIQREERAKLQVLNLERKTLQAQMNPHFIFNSLTSLQNLIIKNDPDLANEYLGKFARLTRIALLQSTQNWVKLKDEITLLEHYIELEQIRFPDHFKYEIKIKLEDPIIFVPPFLIQPFVENAILHGLSKSRIDGFLEILVEESKEQMIQFTIIDNGVGRSEAKDATKKRHQSLGIRLIKERLQLLLKMNAIEIIDLFDDKENAIGTKVVVNVPYKNKIDESVNN